MRASMSIPLFFKAWQFSNNNPDNHIYVDGGMVYNYPIFAFDTDGKPNPETLGCYLSNLNSVAKSNDLKYWELFRYVKFTFETMLDAQVIDFEKDVETENRTINIDNLGISATDFDLSKPQEDALYNSGVKYANQFFDTH